VSLKEGEFSSIILIATVKVLLILLTIHRKSREYYPYYGTFGTLIISMTNLFLIVIWSILIKNSIIIIVEIIPARGRRASVVGQVSLASFIQ
jgi:hypothetical protein